MDLAAIWFILVFVLLAGYVILDGFDLGVGIWYLLGDDSDRRAMMGAIAPVWDGNEVWLITGGGALFAAFPHAYATIFSGFYLAMMGVLLALIVRGVSIEFRNKVDSPRWRCVWDVCFAAGSGVAALLMGVALGNILRGIPLDAAKDYTGTFVDLLNPYSLLIGLAGLGIVAAQGALYLTLKTEGQTRLKAIRWARLATVAKVALVAAAAIATAMLGSRVLANYRAMPILWAVPAATAAAIAGGMLAGKRGRFGWAFILSSVTIILLWALAGLALYPDIVPACNDAELSLTVAGASSSTRTLTVMLVFALAGMPIVIGYQAWLYWTFRRPSSGADATYD